MSASTIELNHNPLVTVEFCDVPHHCGGEYFIIEEGKEPVCVICAIGEHDHIVVLGWHIKKLPRQLVAFRGRK